jgi:hypothetical protein
VGEVADTRSQYVAKKRRDYEAQRTQAEAAEAAQSDSDWSRVQGGALGWTTGFGLGALRGVWNNAKGAAEGGLSAAQTVAFNPSDVALGRSPLDRIADPLITAGAAVANEISNPEKLRADAWDQARQTGRELNPFQGFAPTAAQQGAWAQKTGENAGERAVDLATLAEGALQLKLAKELGYIGKIPTVESYAARGTPAGISKYFAGPYTGRQGSHFIPQRVDFLPKWFMDSPFNRTMPSPRATAGQMYKFHFTNDNKFNGGRVPARFGAGGWSGKRLDWTRPSAAVRWWRGMPLPMKLAGYAGLGGLGALLPNDPETTQP